MRSARLALSVPKSGFKGARGTVGVGLGIHRNSRTLCPEGGKWLTRLFPSDPEGNASRKLVPGRLVELGASQFGGHVATSQFFQAARNAER